MIFVTLHHSTLCCRSASRFGNATRSRRPYAGAIRQPKTACACGFVLSGVYYDPNPNPNPNPYPNPNLSPNPNPNTSHIYSNACMMMVHDLEVQQQEYSPHCCNCTEIGSGGVMQNQPQGAQGTPDPLVLRPLGQPQMGTVVQARAAPVQQPQVGVVVQGTVVKGP